MGGPGLCEKKKLHCEVDQQGDRRPGSNPSPDPGIRAEFKGLGNFRLGSCLANQSKKAPRAVGVILETPVPVLHMRRAVSVK